MGGGFPRRGLAPHERDRGWRRSDKGEAGLPARGSKPLVFRQEPVAGMHAVGAGRPCRIDDAIDPEVALSGRVGTDRHCRVRHSHVQRGTVALGVDGHRRNAHLAAGADDPYGDLAAVRYENPSQPQDSSREELGIDLPRHRRGHLDGGSPIGHRVGGLEQHHLLPAFEHSQGVRPDDGRFLTRCG